MHTCCCGGWHQGVTGDATAESVGARLWCGLTSGELVVYDAETWTLQECHVCAADSIVRRLVCVLECLPKIDTPRFSALTNITDDY